MPMYNLIENSDNYSKTSGRLWQYYRIKPALTDKQEVTGSIGINGTRAAKVMVPLKYFRNFGELLKCH